MKTSEVRGLEEILAAGRCQISHGRARDGRADAPPEVTREEEENISPTTGSVQISGLLAFLYAVHECCCHTPH